MTLTMPMDDTDTSPLLTAVTYQRVSTKEWSVPEKMET